MTTPIMPDFIADMFNEEIRRIQEDVVERICKDFGLDKAKVMEKLGMDKPYVQFSGMRFKILRYYDTPYGSKVKKDKCIARIHNAADNTLHQCKKSQSCEEFCKGHYDKKNTSGLNWGTIHDPIPEGLNYKDKCIARIHNASENTLHQCKRSQVVDGFCKTHFDKKNKSGLNWGTINDPIPDAVKHSESTKIY
jgi:hypothetical protein